MEYIIENGIVYTKQVYDNGTVVIEYFSQEKEFEIVVYKEEQGEDLKISLLVALKKYSGEYQVIDADVDLLLDGELLTTVQANEKGIIEKELVLKGFNSEDMLNIQAVTVINDIEVIGRWEDGEE